VIEDALTGGFGAMEMEPTGEPERPAMLWPVDGASIRINAKWDGDPETPRYAQVTPGQTESNAIELLDSQLMYVRMNPRSFTPFGLGPLEVAFETVNQFLSAHRFAGKLASNAVAQYALWLNEATPAQHDRLIRWWQDEIEGTGRVPLISTEQKPEVLRFAQGTDADLRLAWQEFLIRMVANAFGLPALMLGLESDVNQSTASELNDEAFRGAISPLAMLVAGHITRDLFGKCIGWREFEFVFNELSARDEETELAVQVQLLQAGVLTVDEVRAMRGLGPLPKPSGETGTGPIV
jgi:phage portal protein BeeE